MLAILIVLFEKKIFSFTHTKIGKRKKDYEPRGFYLLVIMLALFTDCLYAALFSQYIMYLNWNEIVLK